MAIIHSMIELARSTWDNTAGRFAILLVALGWVPFALLSAARASLAN